MKNIYISLSPYEVSQYIEGRGEAKSIIVHILRNWKLEQPAYEDILDEIPGNVIKQYLGAENNGNPEDAHKQTEARRLRERIEEEIRHIEQDPIMQQPKALVDINAPVALMQCTREGQMQALELVLRLLDKEKKAQTPERSLHIRGSYNAP